MDAARIPKLIISYLPLLIYKLNEHQAHMIGSHTVVTVLRCPNPVLISPGEMSLLSFALFIVNCSLNYQITQRLQFYRNILSHQPVSELHRHHLQLSDDQFVQLMIYVRSNQTAYETLYYLPRQALIPPFYSAFAPKKYGNSSSLAYVHNL